MTLKWTEKKTLVCGKRAEKKKTVLHFSTSNENIHLKRQFFTSLCIHMAANDHESVINIDFGVTNKF